MPPPLPNTLSETRSLWISPHVPPSCPRAEWPREANIPTYIPKFRNGWEPPVEIFRGAPWEIDIGHLQEEVSLVPPLVLSSPPSPLFRAEVGLGSLQWAVTSGWLRTQLGLVTPVTYGKQIRPEKGSNNQPPLQTCRKGDTTPQPLNPAPCSAFPEEHFFGARSVTSKSSQATTHPPPPLSFPLAQLPPLLLTQAPFSLSSSRRLTGTLSATPRSSAARLLSRARLWMPSNRT